MYQGTYNRLNVRVSDSDYVVLRKARRKLHKKYRTKRERRGERHAFYRAILKLHSEARELYRAVVSGELE